MVAQVTVPTNAAGYQQLLAFARAQASGRRLWAIEGTGSCGAGLARSLLAIHKRLWMARTKTRLAPGSVTS